MLQPYTYFAVFQGRFKKIDQSQESKIILSPKYPFVCRAVGVFLKRDCKLETAKAIFKVTNIDESTVTGCMVTIGDPPILEAPACYLSAMPDLIPFALANTYTFHSTIYIKIALIGSEAAGVKTRARYWIMVRLDGARIVKAANDGQTNKA